MDCYTNEIIMDYVTPPANRPVPVRARRAVSEDGQMMVEHEEGHTISLGRWKSVCRRLDFESDYQPVQFVQQRSMPEDEEMAMDCPMEDQPCCSRSLQLFVQQQPEQGDQYLNPQSHTWNDFKGRCIIDHPITNSMIGMMDTMKESPNEQTPEPENYKRKNDEDSMQLPFKKRKFF